MDPAVGAEEWYVAIIIAIRCGLAACEENVWSGFAIGSDRIYEARLQDEEIVVAYLFAKDAAQFFKAGTCGEFRPLLVDGRARGAAFLLGGVAFHRRKMPRPGPMCRVSRMQRQENLDDDA